MTAVADYMQDEYGALCFQYEYRVAPLSADQRRAAPAEDCNSVAWVCWHMFRNEDVLVNGIMSSGDEVFDAGWGPKIGVDDPSFGTGDTLDDVRRFSAAVDVEALDFYCRAVMDGTRNWLAGLGPEHLVAVPDVDARIAERPGLLGPSAGWVPKVWRNRTRAQMFAYFIVGHGYTHMGEVEGIRTALGLRGR